MEMTIIVDSSGSVVAACRRAQDSGPKIGISPAKQGHTQHELEIPPALERSPLHELVKRIRMDPGPRPRFDPV